MPDLVTEAETRVGRSTPMEKISPNALFALHYIIGLIYLLHIFSCIFLEHEKLSEVLDLNYIHILCCL
jgi:hypothetical protein